MIEQPENNEQAEEWLSPIRELLKQQSREQMDGMTEDERAEFESDLRSRCEDLEQKLNPNKRIAQREAEFESLGKVCQAMTDFVIKSWSPEDDGRYPDYVSRPVFIVAMLLTAGFNEALLVILKMLPIIDPSGESHKQIDTIRKALLLIRAGWKHKGLSDMEE